MAADTRPLTDSERRSLEWHLKQELGGSMRPLLTGSALGAGCLTPVLTFIIAMPVLRLLAMPTPPWWAHAAAVFLLLWAAFATWGFVRRRNKAQFTLETRTRIESDLAGGVARIHRLHATAVMVAYRHQRREPCFFVRLLDGRILFLGRWEPPGCDVPGLNYRPEERGIPSAEVEIATGPESLLILDVRGTGEYLRPVDEFDLKSRSTPPITLDPGSLVNVPWEEIRRVFG